MQPAPPSDWRVVTGPLPAAAPVPTEQPALLGKSLWRRAAGRILPMLLTMLPAWVLHTYLLVVKNEGYSGLQHWSSPYLNVQGNALASTLCFGLGSAALWSVLRSLRSQGPAATLSYLAGAPGRCLPALANKNPDSRVGLALGLGLGLQACRWLGLPGQSRLLLAGACLLWGADLVGKLAGQLLSRWLKGRDLNQLSASLVASLPLAFLASQGCSAMGWPTSWAGWRWPTSPINSTRAALWPPPCSG